MNVGDYLITEPGIDWTRLFGDWIPPLPERFDVWLVNRLGEPIVVGADGAVSMLDLGAGECRTLARSREEFAQRLDAGDNANLWLRIRLVDECRSAGKALQKYQCYGFRIPPTLGGQYESANLLAMPIDSHITYQAYICKQTDIYWIPPH